MKKNYIEKAIILLIFLILVASFIMSIIGIITDYKNVDNIIIAIVSGGFMGVMMYLRLIYDRIR